MIGGGINARAPRSPGRHPTAPPPFSPRSQSARTAAVGASTIAGNSGELSSSEATLGNTFLRRGRWPRLVARLRQAAFRLRPARRANTAHTRCHHDRCERHRGKDRQPAARPTTRSRLATRRVTSTTPMPAIPGAIGWNEPAVAAQRRTGGRRGQCRGQQHGRRLGELPCLRLSRFISAVTNHWR
jgi:hypothetical protein